MDPQGSLIHLPKTPSLDSFVGEKKKGKEYPKYLKIWEYPKNILKDAHLCQEFWSCISNPLELLFQPLG